MSEIMLNLMPSVAIIFLSKKKKNLTHKNVRTGFQHAKIMKKKIDNCIHNTRR